MVDLKMHFSASAVVPPKGLQSARQAPPIRPDAAGAAPVSGDTLDLRFSGTRQAFESRARVIRDLRLAQHRAATWNWLDAQWQAHQTGSEEAYRDLARAERALNENRYDQEAYRELQSLINTPEFREVADAPLKEELMWLAGEYLPVKGRLKEFERDMASLEMTLDQAFGRKKDQAPTGLLELVRLRNRMAREDLQLDPQPARNAAVYADFYTWSLNDWGITPEELSGLTDALLECTEKPFMELGRHLSARTAYRDNPFYYLDGADPVALLRETAARLGRSVDALLEQADLSRDSQRPGKSPQAYCLGVDPPHDVRILASIEPDVEKIKGKNEEAQTLFHEALAHGLDYKALDPNLPWHQRRLHITMTEGHALFMEDLLADPRWMREVLGKSDREADAILKRTELIREYTQLRRLRRALMVIAFERQLYQNPEQDLDGLWESLRAKYLHEPPHSETREDWKDIPHLASDPLYFLNYLAGRVWAAQLKEYMDQNGIHPLSPQAGRVMEGLCRPGLSRSPDELMRELTGQPLGPDALFRKMERLAVRLDWEALRQPQTGLGWKRFKEFWPRRSA